MNVLKEMYDIVYPNELDDLKKIFEDLYEEYKKEVEALERRAKKSC